MDLGEITSTLLRKEGYTVSWLTNGNDGLRAIDKGGFDVCIMDIMLPGKDGYSLVERLHSVAPAVPVIFLSARILPEDVVKGFSVGGDDYIRKPFSIVELLARLERSLERAQIRMARQERWEIGRFVYNHATYELAFEGKISTLSAKSGALLQRFLVDPEGMLDRRSTLIELWGDDDFFNGRSLDVFISKLRRQLEADPRIRIINLRGKGYKLVVDGRWADAATGH